MPSLLDFESHSALTALSQFCRTGEGEIPRGMDPERVAVYRGLISNNVFSTLERAYPLTHSYLSHAQWQCMVHDFCAYHHSKTPYLWRLPHEFYEFTSEEKFSDRFELPFLSELMFFEWLEIEVFMMADGHIPAYHREGDPLFDPLLLHPDQRLDSFHYPVFSKRCGELSDSDRGTYFLLTYRHPEELTVHFLELSPLFAVMVELLRQQPLSAPELTEWLAAQYGRDRDELRSLVSDFFGTMLRKRIALGFL